MTTAIDVRGLSLLVSEANELSNKPNLNKDQQRRFSYLQSAIAAVRSGATLADVEHELHNERAKAAGLSTVNFADADREAELRGWQKVINSPRKTTIQPQEHRDVGGDIPSRVGTYTNLGYFVPENFWPTTFRTLALADPFLNPDVVTVINSTNCRPLRLPIYSDVENVASVALEAYAGSTQNIFKTSQKVLGGWSYKTPRWITSTESFDDMDSAITANALFREFSSDRLARGIGKDCVVGDGTNKPTGLITAMTNLGITPTVAAGAESNTGISGDVSGNSIGSDDLQALFSSINPAYLVSPKCAWLMTHKTLAYLSGLKDKMGNIVRIVKYVDGQPTIFGKPVYQSPSLAEIGGGYAVAFGDLSYCITRLCQTQDSGVVTFREAPGYVEAGLIGFRSFLRADFTFAFDDISSPGPNGQHSPVQYLYSH